MIKLIKSTGKTVKKLAEEMEVSEPLLRQLANGTYPCVVKEENREPIYSYFRVQEDRLFPYVGA